MDHLGRVVPRVVQLSPGDDQVLFSHIFPLTELRTILPGVFEGKVGHNASFFRGLGAAVPADFGGIVRDIYKDE